VPRWQACRARLTGRTVHPAGHPVPYGRDSRRCRDLE